MTNETIQSFVKSVAKIANESEKSIKSKLKNRK